MNKKLINKIKETPTNPGCYIYKNNKGGIIYVGKAKNLKKRVNSYFQKKDHDVKTEKLVKEIVDLDFFVTDSEVEALLLEARLIRENKPKYNIDLKDAVRYAYLKITDEKFPRLLTVRNISGKGKFFGPYTDGSSRARILFMAIKLFKIRTCKRLPKKACLQYHIGNCQAPCEGLISQIDYNKNIKQAELLLKGDVKKLNDGLNKRMKQASAQQKYEEAKIFRDQLESLKILKERQKVDLIKKVNQDVINYITSDEKVLLQIFHIKKGMVLNKEEFKFDDFLLEDFVKQYYSINDIPHEIISSHKINDQELINKYLEKTAKHKVKITFPKKGVKKDLLEMVKNNLILSLEPENQPLVDLQDKLNLAVLPRVIECFDISNIGSSNIVGSMVRFRDGKPDKDNYRKFKVVGTGVVPTQDDFASMGEIVERHYRRLSGLRGSTLKRGVGPLEISAPDLILIDGGLGQLHSAQEKLEKLNLKIPIIGLAKKEELIYTISDNKPIRINKKAASLKLLQKIRDEAHRFAITFHRQRRRK